MSITERKLKDGALVYEIRYSRGRDPITGKQLTPYTTRYTPPASWSRKKALREAKQVEAQFIADCKAGKVLTKAEQREQRKTLAEAAEQERREAAANPTFAAYSKTWLKEKEATISKNTKLSYQIIINRAGEVFNNYHMEEITPYLVKSYITDLFANGKKETDGENLSYRTKTKHFVMLKLLFQTAADDGIISSSPMRDIKKPKCPKSEAQTERKAFTAEEVQHIRECLDKEPPMWKAYITFSLDTGCRRGEVVALRWEDIDLTTGRVTITRNAQYTAGSGVYITATKTGKVRQIYMNPQALAVMKAWKREQALDLLRKGIPQSGFCFTDEKGVMLHPLRPSNYCKKLRAKYNIPGFHPHALRHTMATLSIANGADVVSVSKKLGHSNTSTTLNIYSHANEEAQRKANELLAEQLYKQA